ncbi:hypothetical protein niasHT_017763 [Heterodera trifolii]|uniref:Nuclear receptor domain-containing protein n=1 Tax=Heterodera trifolii TaxID=157864 RepID=A0ABD2LJT9_9BILA
MNIVWAQYFYNNTSPEVKMAIQMELDFVQRLLLGIQNDHLRAIEAMRCPNLKSMGSMENWQQNKTHRTEIIDESSEQQNKNYHGQQRPKRQLTNCKICGRQWYSFYGVKSCESCKQFFRRVVTKQIFFTCPRRNGVGNMVKCRGCRLDKCLVVGMDPTLINVPQSDKFKQFLANLEKPQQHRVDGFPTLSAMLGYEPPSHQIQAVPQLSIPMAEQTLPATQPYFLLEAQHSTASQHGAPPRPGEPPKHSHLEDEAAGGDSQLSSMKPS